MSIKLIMAVAKMSDGKYLLGNNHVLPWHIPEELKTFKEITNGSMIIMGYNTAKSLNFKCLPNRINCCVCDTTRLRMTEDDPIYSSTMMIADYSDLHVIFGAYRDIFIIGGPQIYSHVIRNHFEKISEIYISWIDPSNVDKELIKPVYATNEMLAVLENQKPGNFFEKFGYTEIKNVEGKFKTVKGISLDHE